MDMEGVVFKAKGAIKGLEGGIRTGGIKTLIFGLVSFTGTETIETICSLHILNYLYKFN